MCSCCLNQQVVDSHQNARHIPETAHQCAKLTKRYRYVETSNQSTAWEILPKLFILLCDSVPTRTGSCLLPPPISTSDKRVFVNDNVQTLMSQIKRKSSFAPDLTPAEAESFTFVGIQGASKAQPEKPRNALFGKITPKVIKNSEAVLTRAFQPVQKRLGHLAHQ